MHVVLFRQSALLDWDILGLCMLLAHTVNEGAAVLERKYGVVLCELQVVSLCPNVDLCPGI